MNLTNDEGDNVQQKDALPKFWELLPEPDKAEYTKLRETLDISCCKRNRGHRIEAFDAVLDAIRRYIEKNDADDWKRSLVCGVCWMDNMIAINTRQLRLLISKCKSSINGSLQRLGYLTNPSHSESWKVLFSRIPFLKDNFNELRQWTIRCKMDPKPQSIILAPVIPAEMCYSPNGKIQLKPMIPFIGECRIQHSQQISSPNRNNNNFCGYQTNINNSVNNNQLFNENRNNNSNNINNNSNFINSNVVSENVTTNKAPESNNLQRNQKNNNNNNHISSNDVNITSNDNNTNNNDKNNNNNAHSYNTSDVISAKNSVNTRNASTNTSYLINIGIPSHLPCPLKFRNFRNNSHNDNQT